MVGTARSRRAPRERIENSTRGRTSGVGFQDDDHPRTTRCGSHVNELNVMALPTLTPNIAKRAVVPRKFTRSSAGRDVLIGLTRLLFSGCQFELTDGMRTSQCRRCAVAGPPLGQLPGSLDSLAAGPPPCGHRPSGQLDCFYRLIPPAATPLPESVCGFLRLVRGVAQCWNRWLIRRATPGRPPRAKTRSGVAGASGPAQQAVRAGRTDRNRIRSRFAGRAPLGRALCSGWRRAGG
jgi:hypothetical protein